MARGIKLYAGRKLPGVKVGKAVFWIQGVGCRVLVSKLTGGCLGSKWDLSLFHSRGGGALILVFGTILPPAVTRTWVGDTTAL